MGESGESGLWRPPTEIEAEVAAAVAAAGEVVAEDLGESEESEAGDVTRAVGLPAARAVVSQITADPTVALPVPQTAAETAPTIALPVPQASAEQSAAQFAAAAPTVALPVPIPQPAAEQSAAGAPSSAVPAPIPEPRPAAEPQPVPAPATGASALTPDQVSRHIARAEALAELGRRQQALDVLNELIVAGCEDVRVWRSLAAVYLETGDGDKALRAANWVVTFAPDDEWGHRLRALALRLLDRPDEAVTAAEQAVRLGPDVWQSRASLAAALHTTGDLTKAAEEARKAADLAAKLDPDLAPEAQKLEEAVAEAEAPGGLVADLEAVLASRPGPDDESLAHVGNLVLRSMEFSAVAGWLVSYGGLAIPGFNIRFLIPIAVLVVLSAFLLGPARRAGRDLWRYLAEYLWQDPKTRYALIMTLAAHAWMITGSSIGHLQGGSTLTIGLLTHLTGRTVLAKKAPELNPVKRAARPAPRAAE